MAWPLTKMNFYKNNFTIHTYILHSSVWIHYSPRKKGIGSIFPLISFPSFWNKLQQKRKVSNPYSKTHSFNFAVVEMNGMERKKDKLTISAFIFFLLSQSWFQSLETWSWASILFHSSQVQLALLKQTIKDSQSHSQPFCPKWEWTEVGRMIQRWELAGWRINPKKMIQKQLSAMIPFLCFALLSQNSILFGWDRTWAGYGLNFEFEILTDSGSHDTIQTTLLFSLHCV